MHSTPWTRGSGSGLWIWGQVIGQLARGQAESSLCLLHRREAPQGQAFLFVSFGGTAPCLGERLVCRKCSTGGQTCTPAYLIIHTSLQSGARAQEGRTIPGRMAQPARRAPESESQGCSSCSPLMGWGLWNLTRGMWPSTGPLLPWVQASSLPAPAVWDNERRGLLDHMDIRAAKEQGVWPSEILIVNPGYQRWGLGPKDVIHQGQMNRMTSN